MARAATATASKPKASAATGPALKMVEVAAGNTKNALAALDAGKGAMHMIAPGKLRVIPGFNVRVHETESYKTDLAELAHSIKTEGFYQSKPITGYVGKDGEEDVIYVTDGHRRLEATRMAIAEGAEITSVPVVLRDPKTSMVDLTVSLVRENTGRRLTMLENAIAVKRLLSAGLTEDEIATRLNFTKRGVSDFLILITAPKSIRRAVMDYDPQSSKVGISGSEAVRILRKYGEDTKKAEAVIAEMIEKAAKRGAKAATRKDSGDAPIKGKKAENGAESEDTGPKVRMASFETKWAVGKGQSFDLKEVRHFKNLFGDNDWFTPDENKAGWATATEDVEFRAVIRRPKKDEAPPVKEEAEATEETEAEEEEEGEGEGAEPEAEAEQGDL